MSLRIKRYIDLFNKKYNYPLLDRDNIKKVVLYYGDPVVVFLLYKRNDKKYIELMITLEEWTKSDGDGELIKMPLDKIDIKYKKYNNILNVYKNGMYKEFMGGKYIERMKQYFDEKIEKKLNKYYAYKKLIDEIDMTLSKNI